MQRKLIVLSVAAALLLNAVGAVAQERSRQLVVTPPVEDEVFIAQGPVGPVGPVPPAVEVLGDNVIFLATEMSFAGKLVKGAPYSAQAVTESVQALTDGNRIVRRNSAQVYRDTEGRTRRDQTLGYIGPYSTAGDVPQTVFINDPVAGVHYILDPSSKTARKLPRMELRFKTEGGAAQGGSVMTFERQAAPPGAAEKIAIERNYTFNVRTPGPDAQATGSSTVVVAPPAPGAPAPPTGDGPPIEFFTQRTKHEAKAEKLEARSFDGVQAEGTRTTLTIPAGEIGNEQPIQIVDERWYSPELQVVVMTRHSDPRSGETTYRLTNISRTEPAASLFQVPSDYNVKDMSTTPGPGVRRIRRTPPPQEDRQ